jgi:2-oxoglutarate dehydrogenase E2 component (dihydrolipoamide succinyltransferase)
MADIEIKVPDLGESESEATLISWLKKEGELVEVDDVLAEIESDKITMEITALDAGVLKTVIRQVDEVVEPGEVIGIIDDAAPAVPVEVEAEETPGTAPGIEQAEPEMNPAAEEKEQKITKDAPASAVTGQDIASGHRQERVPMSRLRQRIAGRLKQAQNTAAMLTTFNEVNMQSVMDLRARYGDAFLAKHGVKLGLMSFFVRAVSQAVSQYPALNAYIEDGDVVYHNYLDVGIAVSTDKGVIAPVLRDANLINPAQIEKGIADLAAKARDGGLTPDDLRGGTFSITNGGIFGSMLSTPILNPPQSGILGMHNIQKRPVVEKDEIVIRPIMYLALTYDHRLVDGSEAVRFLVAVRNTLEYPGSLTLDL